MLDAVSNVVTEIPLTIMPSSWSSTSPYTYTWTDSRVLSDSSVEVDILNTSADTTVDYIDYTKSSGGGGIVFTANNAPTANINIVITITNAQAHAGSSIDADTVATDAISGASNVDEALTVLDGKMPTLLWTNPSVSATGEATIASGIDFKGFTLFAVRVKVNVSVSKYVTQLVSIGDSTQISYVTDSQTQNANVWYRYIAINNGNIYVENATRGDGTNNTSVLIPEALYGIM